MDKKKSLIISLLLISLIIISIYSFSQIKTQGTGKAISTPEQIKQIEQPNQNPSFIQSFFRSIRNIFGGKVSELSPKKIGGEAKEERIQTDYFESESIFDEIYPIEFREEKLTIENINKAIKREGGLWKAKENPISELPDEEIEKLLGLKITDEELQEIEKRKEESTLPKGRDDLPDFFDWRDLHGGLDYTTPIRDQSSCGSCWAFGAVGALEAGIDAYYNNPNLDINLSEQDLVSCYLVDGCYGASVSEIEDIFSDYYQNTGVANETCFPYTATNNDCDNKCNNWQEGAWKTFSYESPELTIDAIKTTLIENGSVEVGMEVYEDFLSYENGIYHHVTGGLLGYHAVLVVGFGVYDGMDYWIVKNSWNNWWGEDGYFRILVGDCLIDSWFAYAVEQPEPLLGNAPEKLCTDNDNDNYCYWGLSNKPSNCPTCDNLIADCDDSNATIFENCGQNTKSTGFLNINSNPSDAKVYVKDLNSGEGIYRGKTPIEFELNVGGREVKISKEDYRDYFKNISILEDETANLVAELDLAPKLIYPLNNDVLRAGDIIEINGTAPEPDFQSFSVEYGIGENPTEWFTNGINLINNGAQPIINDTLAYWNTSFINEAGFYIIKLTVFYSGEQIEKQVLIFLDPQFQDGWPLYSENYLGASPTNIVRLFPENNKQLLQTVGGFYNPEGIYGWVYVLNQNGEFPPNTQWPFVTNELDCSEGSTPVVGDINGDSYLEIVSILGSYHLYAFDRFGNILQGFPFIWGNSCGGNTLPVSLADMDNDGVLDIIAGFDRKYLGEGIYGESSIFVINSQGEALNGWPHISYDNELIYLSLIVADVDNDGNNEIITSQINALGHSANCGIYVFESDGSIKSGWPKYTNGWAMWQAVADIDNDGDLEIFVNSLTEGKLYAYHHDGTAVSGWPQTIDEEMWGAPVIGNIDGDNDLEIIIAGTYKYYAFHHNGTPVSNWVILGTGNNYANQFPIIVDINNDGAGEVFLGFGNKLYCYTNGNNGAELIDDSWPKVTARRFIAGPTIEDLDNDGDIEINVNDYWSGYLYVWDLNYTYNPLAMEWPMFQHDERHTGDYNSQCSDKTFVRECSSTQPFYCNENGELIGCQLGCENNSCIPHTGSCWDFPVNATRCIYYDEFHGGPAYWLQFCNGINHAWTNQKECLQGCDFENNICIINQTCSDGTLYRECSSNQPLYCENGTLINNCQECNCPPDKTCQQDGNCVIPYCLDNTLHENCSLTQPLYCNNGELINNCQECGCPSDYSCYANGNCYPPGGGSSGCFEKGSKIYTPQGYKAIESIKPRDIVYSFDDFDHSNENNNSNKGLNLKKAVVNKLLVHENFEDPAVVLILSNGIELNVTLNHPFYDPVAKLYKPLWKFDISNNILYYNDSLETFEKIIIKNIFLRDFFDIEYNLEVNDTHNFLVDGIVVHNDYWHHEYPKPDPGNPLKSPVPPNVTDNYSSFSKQTKSLELASQKFNLFDWFKKIFRF